MLGLLLLEVNWWTQIKAEDLGLLPLARNRLYCSNQLLSSLAHLWPEGVATKQWSQVSAKPLENHLSS